MKVYTSQITQHGRELMILNEKVKFDKTGCAEIEDEKFAKKLIQYSDWFTTERPTMKMEPKKATLEDSIAEQQLEAAKFEVEKLKKMNESRKSRADKLTVEINDLRSELGKRVDEVESLKKELETEKEFNAKEREDWEHRFKLAMLNLNELRSTCRELGTKKELYETEKNKEKLIDIIINSTE